MIASITTAAILAASLAGQQASETEKSATEARLARLRNAASKYRIAHTEKPNTVLQLQPDPAFHHGDQPGEHVEEGAIFLWTGEGRRPEAAAQIFKDRDVNGSIGGWTHEFTSLSQVPLTTTRDQQTIWAPTVAGLEFKLLPSGAPRPADSPVRRMSQMSTLARNFRATDDWAQKGWTELRLLAKPVCRYGEPGTTVRDGALFAFVHGTDPEIFLLIEERQTAGRSEWRYALAPMSTYALKVSYQGNSVWEVPPRWPARDPTAPLLQYHPQTVAADSTSR
jgi:hypothetical protein